MFCCQCGTRAEGNFCSACGARLPGAAPLPEAMPEDWSDEIRYERLMLRPEVRDLIARHAASAIKRMTGEEFLGHCDKVLKSLPGGASLATVASVVQPVYARLGIRTGKRRTEVVARPPGKALVAVLCSLARRGRTLREVRQAQDGCVLQASLPSDLFSFEGDLLITIRRHEGGTLVEAAATVKGQLFDWGKSRRCLNELFEDLGTVLP